MMLFKCLCRGLPLCMLLLMVTAVRCQSLPAGNVSRPSPLRLRDIQAADPQKDLRKAIARNDLRFVGIYGFAMIVPGVAGDAFNSLVRIKGINAVQGTGDAHRHAWESRREAIAYRYASGYNRSLLRHLRCCQDPDLLRLQRESERELRHMESADPLSDARAAMRHGDFRLIGTAQAHQPSQIPGLTGQQSAELRTRMLTANGDLVTDQQRLRLHRAVATYVIPGNRFLCDRALR